MAKKINQQLLNEELKKFKRITEYTFYTEEPKTEDNLILGTVDEAGENGEEDLDFSQQGGPAAADPNASAMPPAAPTDDSKSSNPNGQEQMPPAAPAAPAQGPEAGADAGTDDENLFGTGDDMGDDMETASGEDEVDIDVTELVDSTEGAKHSADKASHKASRLMQQFSKLAQKVDAMASISHKIDSLEKEIVKRNPTPVEKLEMRSLDSYPFNIKLNDYWKDVEGYDTGVNDKPKEYVLRKDDIDNTFASSQLKNSFNVKGDEYEEEDI